MTLRLALFVFSVGSVLSACDPAGDDEQDDGAADLPSPWIYEDGGDSEEPGLELGEIGEGLSAAVAQALAVDIQPLFDGYDDVMEDADPGGCPYGYTEPGDGYEVVYWYDYCQTGEGAWYNGYSAYVTYDGYHQEGDDYTYSGHQLYLVGGDMLDADGNGFQGSGAAQVLRGEASYGTLFYKVIEGEFTWEGPAAAGSYLESDLDPFVSIAALWFPEYRARYVQLAGGISGLEGPFDTLSMSGNLLYDAVLGSSCDQEPSGSLSVRDPGGSWYDVVFDGAEDGEDPVPAELCDGCGQAWFRGALLGEVCADFSPLLAWEGEPW